MQCLWVCAGRRTIGSRGRSTSIRIRWTRFWASVVCATATYAVVPPVAATFEVVHLDQKPIVVAAVTGVPTSVKNLTTSKKTLSGDSHLDGGAVNTELLYRHRGAHTLRMSCSHSVHFLVREACSQSFHWFRRRANYPGEVGSAAPHRPVARREVYVVDILEIAHLSKHGVAGLGQFLHLRTRHRAADERGGHAKALLIRAARRPDAIPARAREQRGPGNAHAHHR